MRFLIKRARKRDKAAFVELIEQQKTAMYKIAGSYLRSEDDIADAIQDTVLACYEKIGSLQNDRYFKTWLTRILINKCMDVLRRGNKEYPFAEVPECGESCMELENYEFYELLNSLDEKYRIILVLYYAEGFKIREIAQILELEENTVKTRLSRARRQLAKEYGQEAAGTQSRRNVQNVVL